MRRHRVKAQALRAVGQALHDVVVRTFELPAFLRHVAVEHVVQLLDDAHGQRHVRGAFVDECQSITVARDFLLGAVLWRGAVQNQ